MSNRQIHAGALVAPFPWFGGKRAVAAEVWARLGDVPNYVEPFFGSGAVLLARPHVGHTETINDKDRFVANFWRATQADPEAVAYWLDWPVNEADLHARHWWLLTEGAARIARIDGDPDFFDTKVAGWWCWGACAWIGSGWCSGEGPWQWDGERWVDRQLPHLGDAGQGINRKLPHLGSAGQGINRKLPHLGNAGRGINRQLPHLGNAGRGINRQLPHLGNAGQGINRKLPHLGDAGRGINRQRPHLGNAGQGINRKRPELLAWVLALADRMRRVRVVCGDWSRVCGPSVTHRHGLTGVFLDPPYADTADRTAGIYATDDLQVAHAAREWAIAEGRNPLMRIAFAGYEGEHEFPPDWDCWAWKARGGFGNQGAGRGRENAARERIWFSPHCLPPVQRGLFAETA